MEDRLFPEELLKGTVEEKWEFFQAYPLDHPLFNTAFNNIMTQIEVSRGNDSVILVYGPTRVGKSFLAEKLFQAIENKYKKEKEQNKGVIPVVEVEAASPEKGQFDWQAFYISALEKLEDVLIDHKAVPELPKGGYKKAREYRKTAVLNLALINALKSRQTKVLIIDEAHHMAKRLRGDTLKDQMDVIKTLANKTKIPIVMLGTYDLQLFKDQSGQLASRGMHNHLTRYNYEIEVERMNFIRCLYSFQQLLPLKEEPSLVEHYKYFYSRTLGCIGQLKLLFSRTLRGKLMENPHLETLEVRDFEKYALTLDQCEKVLEEIVQGEKLEAVKMSEHSLFRKLGMLEDENEEQKEDNEEQKEDNEEQKEDNEATKSKDGDYKNIEKTVEEGRDNKSGKENSTGKPFRRNPKRDSVETPVGFDGLKRAID
ncbi:TniB family NTP-binding protein [uncultured Metabacillus sp.]|uniref:TniB family NTP-binding protein n=1 Tax=uncultured Metabacillus sp. TaxID=2860135 RepID=UPI00261AA828|nr:TniB family NTP-binding protein [uncultured Metabacillus sp.]